MAKKFVVSDKVTLYIDNFLDERDIHLVGGITRENYIDVRNAWRDREDLRCYHFPFRVEVETYKHPVKAITITTDTVVVSDEWTLVIDGD